MITTNSNKLNFEFLPKKGKDKSPNAKISIGFERTIRVPDDNKRHYLPPSLGNFPIKHIEDYDLGSKNKLKKRGGVLIPMFQADALWLDFTHDDYYSLVEDFNINCSSPIALKVATGKICAISGNTWSEGLSEKTQNYIVLPEQPWLDGYNDSKGSVRQFVAAPLGKGLTVEKQLTGNEEIGGIQIQAFPLKKKYYDRLISKRLEEAKVRAKRRAERIAERASREYNINYSIEASRQEANECIDLEMGLAAGGRIQQEIYKDPFGPECWDTNKSQRCFITLANATQWMKITGEEPPISPMNAEEYTRAGGVWFDYYDDDNKAIKGAKKLGKVKSIKKLSKEKRYDFPSDTSFSSDAYFLPTSDKIKKELKQHVVKILTPLQKAKRGISDGSWWK